MNFIEKIAQAKDIKAKRDGATSSLKYWTVILTNLTKEKTKVGLDGDFEKVKEIESQIQEAEAALQQAKEALSNIPPYRAELKRGWVEYIEAYNRDFRKKYKAYKEAKRVLCESYMEIVERQREMLSIRQDLASVLSEKPVNFFDIDGSFAPEAPAPEMLETPNETTFTKFNGHSTTADAAFFCEAGVLSCNCLPGIHNVVIARMPCKKAYLKPGITRYQFLYGNMPD